MKFREILKEVFDVGLFKRNMQNAISTITSEMQNVQANMAEKDGTIKKQEEENERLQQDLKISSDKVRAMPDKPVATPSDTGVGTSVKLPTT